MASTAAFRDDISGAIATGGTSTAYTVTSYQVFDSLAHLNGQVVAFTPHATNGASPTLNVDSLGAKPIRAKSGVDLQSGVLIQGTPYAALYNSSDAVFYLFGVGPDPGIPLGASVDYWGSSAPSSYFVFPYGQAISRTTYAALFSLIGTGYGSGDGSTTFNIPDIRGRIVAGADGMGGSLAGRLDTASGMNGTGVGAVGGAQTKTLLTANLPAYTPSGTISGSVTSLNLEMRSSSSSGGNVANTVSQGNGGGTSVGGQNVNVNSSSISATFTGTAQGGTSTPVAIIQPTIVANKLIRII
jgi:microcystin-dependent protein